MPTTRTTSLQRLYHMEPARRGMLLRAAVTLAAASAAVALLPFRRAIAFGSAPISPRVGSPVSDWVWAVEAAARRLPWRAKCIQQGIAAQRLLRRDGTNARLHYGARHGAGGKLEAHVWVSVDGAIVIGGEEAKGFAEVASFP